MSNVYTLQLSKFTQPEATVSVTKEWAEVTVKGTRGVRWYDYLIERYRNSPTNNAVLNNIAKITYDKGLTARDAHLKPNEYARLKMMFAKDSLKNVIKDYSVLGSGAFQVLKKEGEITRAEHIPMHLLSPEKCDDEGNINGWWYSDDWSDTRKYPPRYIPNLGTSKEDIELVVFGEYSIGRKYIFDIDYQGCLDYTYLEEKICEYLINDVENGFSPTTVVNYNNGITDEELQKQIVKKTEDKATGTTGKKTIVSFNKSKETQVDVQQFPLNDAPEHFQYLADECRDKILAGHNVVSSMLVGIAKEGQGFSNNGEEMKVAKMIFKENSISYKQETILDAIDRILAEAKISLDLIFGSEPVKPGPVQMSSHDKEMTDFVTSKGEDIGEDWVLVDSRVVDYDQEDDLDSQISSLNLAKESWVARMARIVSTGTARPNANSEQDNEKFKTRYRYTGEAQSNSRPFCVGMLKSNKVYRKEDIMRMGSEIVNQGWGPKGADTYDIWLYKGGGNCGHVWTRETYARKSDVRNPNAQIFTPAEQRKAGFIAPVNDKKVYQKPRDMKNNGFLEPQG